MSDTATTTRVRSNAEVARIMLISGAILLGFFVASILGDRWVSENLNDWNATGKTWLFDIWRLVANVSPALGSALVVGSIIVNRLPDFAPSDAGS